MLLKCRCDLSSRSRKRSSVYDERIVDVMEELVRFTVLLRPVSTR